MNSNLSIYSYTSDTVVLLVDVSNLLQVAVIILQLGRQLHHFM